MELVDYLRMLRRRWVWVVGTVVVLLALAMVYLAITPKTYKSTADVFIGSTAYSSNDSGADNNNSLQASNYVFDRIDTYAQMVDSPGVLGPVIKALGLDETPEALAKQVSGSVVPSTVIVSIAVTDGDAQRAQDIAAETAKQFMAYIKSVDVPVPGKPTPLAPQITVPAVVPGAPDSPSRTLVLALALIVGLGLGMVLASLRDQSRRGSSRRAAHRDEGASRDEASPRSPSVELSKPARAGDERPAPSLEEVLGSSRPRRSPEGASASSVTVPSTAADPRTGRAPLGGTSNDV